MQKNGLIYFLLLWIVSNCSVSCSKPCPTLISKGAFSAACNAVVGSTCSFSCEAGYMWNISASWVTCQASTEWSADLTSLCLRPDGQQCPYYIPRGHLNLTCIREPGHTCSFTCYEGYRPSISPPTIACGSDLEWNHNPENLCNETICPKLFEGGSVSESCSRKYKATCYDFLCNPGYVKLSRAYAVQCNESGNWVNPDGTSSACVREDQLCPDKFPGGYINSYCNRIHKERCSYFCHSGYLHNSSITWLTCQENRLWDVDTKLLCMQSVCNMQIPHGEITWWCATSGPPCPYSCHEGYKQSDTVSWLTCSTSGQWVPFYPYRLDGVQFSIEDLCTHISNTSSSTTFRTTSPAATGTSISGERSGGGNVGTIVGITVGTLTGIIIVAFFVGWIAKRISVPNIRDPGHVRNTCLRPRENPVRNVNTIRQQHDADCMGNISSFESPSYDGLYVHSFVQRIPTISSSCNYQGPPPSYSKIPIASNESPPTYEEVATDPSKFNLYI